MGASLPLKITLALVMIASAIELALISATVAYLHQLGNKTLPVFSSPGQTTHIPGLPATLLVDQGHTSNGAAGTGLIIIGLGGIIALWLRARPSYYYHGSGFGRFFYRLWLGLNVPALLLTLGALAYVFVVTNMHRGQSVELSAVSEAGHGSVTYPVGTWTPQGWFDALLGLEFVNAGDRDAVLVHQRLARGWQFNLIPLLLVQVAQTVCALLDARRRRAESGVYVSANVDSEAGFGEK